MKRRLVRLATPTYTLGSVVLVFDAPRENMLMLLQPPGKAWTLPAGLMERREEPVDAAQRELHEETGIDASFDEIQPATPCAVVHTHGRWVDNVFTVTKDPSDTELTVDGSEVWDIAWHPVDDLPLMTRSTANLLRHYGLGPRA